MVSATLMSASPFHPGAVRDGPIPSSSTTNHDKNLPDSKAILQTALKKAQLAVEYDSHADFPNALKAYQSALSLITSVLDSSPSFRSNSRLLNIQSSYLERVTLLSSLVDTSSELSFLGHDLLSNLERDSLNDQYSYTEGTPTYNGFRSLTPSPTSSINHPPPDTTLAEGHDVLSSTIDAITSWSHDFDQLGPSVNGATPSLNKNTVSGSPKPQSAVPNTMQTSSKKEASETFSRARSAGGKKPATTHRESKWVRLSLKNHDSPGSLQLPQMGLMETSGTTVTSLKRRKSDTLASATKNKLEGRSTTLVFEAEFPKGIQALSLRRPRAPLLTSYRFETAPLPFIRSPGDHPINTSHDNQSPPAQPQVPSSSRNNNRRMSSHHSNSRPNSFHLAATKVVELAVNDSTSSSSAVASRQPIRNHNFVTIQQVFKEHPPKDCVYEPPPSSGDLRIFWLLRSLEKSMLSGGYLTSKLFVPKSVWVQPGVRLQAIETKVHSCDVIVEFLSRFEGFALSDPETVLKELEGLNTILDTVQNGLARKLPYIETLRKIPTSALASFGSRISKSVEKLQKSYIKLKSDATLEYVEGILKLIRASQFLENWYVHFSSLPPRQGVHVQILARLNRVNKFLGAVFSAFVVRDMSIMLAKYHKRLRNSINE